MDVNSLTTETLTTGLGTSRITQKDSPERIRQAASQFEALLIGQILKSAHGEEGWLGTGEDQTASSAMAIADEYLGQALAARGGLGLAHMVAAGLERRVSEPDPPKTSD